jgi:hypothetical protein
MDIDEREERLHDFEEGRDKHFATKPILSGSGSNFQYHCHKAIYVGMPGDGYKFNDFIQSLYRLQRFGQQHPVEIDIIYSEDMRAGRAALEEKWALDAEMRKRMSEIIKRTASTRCRCAMRCCARSASSGSRSGARTSSRSTTTPSPNAAPGRRTRST